MEKKKHFLVFFLFVLLNISIYAENPAVNTQDTTKNTNIQPPKSSQKAKYIGANECGICHSKEYENWKEQGHSKTSQRLTGKDKENPNCLKCHSTGYGEEKLYAEVNLESVQCEACHGPGSLYRPMDIMKVRKKANELGLIFPIDPMKTCRKCHLHRQDRATPLCPGRD